ncbi:YbhB/YbcL family Raf kinase inhibitor-like protein [Mucilaginibacter lutimaris]|uniref:YbhB/YbcL family Raf kinase inhibitor-like protein n=1 Tax=Mucilaginibacter lutimaris TaxID=931629 RepID=A0ABW2ZDX2_9SPHI
MKKILFVLVVLCHQASAQTFTLKSDDLGGQFSETFTCSGENRSPELHWSNAPAATKSFAITMYDPDAPTGSGFWHWVIVDIPATTMAIKQNSLPAGSLTSVNDTGKPGYQGPCPPEGDAAHRYIITVYAVNTAKLGTTSTAAMTGFMLNKAAIAKASILVYAKR